MGHELSLGDIVIADTATKQLYAYYKQGIMGDNETPKPGLMDFTVRVPSLNLD